MFKHENVKCTVKFTSPEDIFILFDLIKIAKKYYSAEIPAEMNAVGVVS